MLSLASCIIHYNSLSVSQKTEGCAITGKIRPFDDVPNCLDVTLLDIYT